MVTEVAHGSRGRSWAPRLRPPQRAHLGTGGTRSTKGSARTAALRVIRSRRLPGKGPSSSELRRSILVYAETLDPRRLVFLDEAGNHIALIRDDGRAPRGQRVLGGVARNRGEVTTLIGRLASRAFAL